GYKRLLQVIIVGERVSSRFFVDRQDAMDELGVILEEIFAGVQDSPGVGLRLAIEQPSAVLYLCLRHHRVEAGPSVDVAADQRRLAVRMLQQHWSDVLFGKFLREQGAHQEDMRVGAAGYRYALALEVGDRRDRAVLAGHQRGPFGAGIDVDRLDRIAIDPADKRGRTGSRAEIERA